MKYIYPMFALLGLLLLVLPSIMHYTGSMNIDLMKHLMFVGTLVWFAAAIPWLGKKSSRR